MGDPAAMNPTDLTWWWGLVSNIGGTVVGGALALVLVDRLLKRWLEDHDARVRTRERLQIASDLEATPAGDPAVKLVLGEVAARLRAPVVVDEDDWNSLTPEQQTEAADAAGEQWMEDQARDR